MRLKFIKKLTLGNIPELRKMAKRFQGFYGAAPVIFADGYGMDRGRKFYDLCHTEIAIGHGCVIDLTMGEKIKIFEPTNFLFYLKGE
jgi:hypothetical protein